MEPYRLYVLNPFDGRIVQKREFVAKDDETAVWISEAVRHARPMELWHGSSKIHQWHPLSFDAAAPASPLSIH